MELTDHKTCNHGRGLKEQQNNVSARTHTIIECSMSTILSILIGSKQKKGEIRGWWNQQAIQTDAEESITPISKITQPCKKTKKAGRRRRLDTCMRGSQCPQKMLMQTRESKDEVRQQHAGIET